MTSHDSTDQPRIPGVRYRKVKLYRPETTVIDGVASTRQVPYTGWEEKPARDWDALVLRGLIGITITFTVVAITATTASIGGLLSPLVPTGIAYAMASVFPVAWLYCLGIEWLNRINPERAKAAKVGGWITLVLSMTAVVVFGTNIHQPWAGGFGAGIDLLAKTFWLLLLREHAVPLNAGVAHWVVAQEQQLAGRYLLARRLAKLNRTAVYQRAVGGVEYDAADAILARAAAGSLPQAPAEPAPEPAPAPAAPTAPVPSAAPAPSVASVAQPTVTASPAAAAPAVATVPAPPAPVPSVRQISLPSIAAICREQIKADSAVSNADLHAAVLAAGHPDHPGLPDTVRRTALRIDSTRKAS